MKTGRTREVIERPHSVDVIPVGTPVREPTSTEALRFYNHYKEIRAEDLLGPGDVVVVINGETHVLSENDIEWA